MQIIGKMLSQRIKYTYQVFSKYLATHPNFTENSCNFKKHCGLDIYIYIYIYIYMYIYIHIYIYIYILYIKYIFKENYILRTLYISTLYVEDL